MALDHVFPVAAPASRARDRGLRRIAWFAVLIAAALGSSFTFFCVAPFAAFAVLTAATLSRRDAFLAVGLIWLANQILGFSALGYPFEADALLWGIAIGVAIFAATQIAVSVFGALRGKAWWQTIPAAFVAAFVTYEVLLYLVSLALGGSQNFALDIDAKLALSDACWLLGLGILRYWLASFAPTRAPLRQPVHS